MQPGRITGNRKLYAMPDQDNNNKNDILAKTLISAMPEIPEEVTSWLGRLVLLYGVPFNYLIPDEKMLPEESLRFFFIDPIWMQALVQGACSIGSNGYGDRIIDTVMNEWIQPNQPDEKNQASLANKKAAGVRDQLREQYEDVPLPPEETCLDWPLTGFLLRSAVVEGWRGLEVMAYRNLTEPETQRLTSILSGQAKEIFNEAMKNKKQRDNLRAELREFLRGQTTENLKALFQSAGVQTQEALLKLMVELVKPLKPLRIEQLSKDVMLGLFNGIIDQLVIRQPQEGLHFGLVKQAESYTKNLRELGYKNPATAGEILNEKVIDLSSGDLMRDAGRKVVNIQKLTDKMKQELSSLGQLKLDPLNPNNFTSAEFAVEMIEAAGEFTYYPAIKTS